MEFSLTQEQKLIKDQIYRFAREEIAPRVQEHDLAARFDFESWRRLGEMSTRGRS
jgi:alkylation response protein AidB-like acyl-CoA dehydrogenase